MALTPEQVAIMSRMEAPKYALFLRIERPSGTDRLWTGFGNIAATADDAFEASAIYKGMGILRELPELSSLPSGAARRFDISFSGVHALPRSWMLPTTDIFKSPIRIGTVDFDDDFQMTDAIDWEVSAKVDVVRSSDDGGVRTVTVSCIAGSATLARARNTHWTPAQHRKNNPTDTAMKMVPSMSVMRILKW
ncbi:hypothetical protein Q1W73_16450 [Asticcacaulis sp. ZE23SCel15]|uniref:hypothetical protein n=1 Tax=Asticcacaulis sp. ZE23SCel15 TaxID=3059027 RepID=UPI00265FF7C9|nr:hypothetical protein [Asticcacaulis sp. ZE23SCel15]WKL57234.1 hypothetical protein Q1W73_16450 [Asticcacaulis sp. ZE23SCel15]